MSKLAQYGGRVVTIDGVRVVEMRDPNDNSRSRHQYRVLDGVTLEHRLLASDGRVVQDWTPRTPEITHRPEYCPDCGAFVVDRATTPRAKDKPAPDAYFSGRLGRWLHHCKDIEEAR